MVVSFWVWDNQTPGLKLLKVKLLVSQSCLILCDPMDCSPPGSSSHGDSPGRNTGVICHALLQGTFPPRGTEQESPAPRASLVAQLVKTPPAMWETWVWSLGWEDPLEKGKATHSSTLAWKTSMNCIGHGVAKSRTWLSNFHLHSCTAGRFFTIWATKWWLITHL